MPRKKHAAPADPDALRLEKNASVLETFTHDLSGHRLVLCELKKPDADGSTHAVAWVAPWQKTLTAHELFSSRDEAGASFAARKSEAPPERQASLKRDWQVSAVYKWEDKAIGQGTPHLTEKQMQQVARQLCKDFNLAAIDLKYKEPRRNAKYKTSWYQDGRITLTHKQFEVVLHEITHAVDEKVNGNVWADHGPSFVRTLIALAAKYHWSDPEELEKSAKEAGIMVAPAASVPALKVLP